MSGIIFLDIDGVPNSFQWMERADTASAPAGPETAARLARAAVYLHIPPEAFPGHEHRLVQTDVATGLQDENCLHAPRLLKHPGES